MTAPRRWPLRTLRSRLAMTYAGVALFSVTSAALYNTTALRGMVIDLITMSLLSQAHLIAQAVREPLGARDAAAVEEYLARVDPITYERILVLDRQGEPVAATANPPPFNPHPTDRRIAEALAGQRGVADSIDSQTPQERVQVTVPVALADGQVVGVVRTAFTVQEVRSLFAELTRDNAIAAAGAAGLAAVVGLLLAASLARPIGQVARAATALAAGQPAPPLAESGSGPQEVRALVRAFNDLARQLGEHEQARREFASDVSHELHSLAAAMQTAAEALDRGAGEADPELARQLAAGLVGHTHRLTRLAGDLLELARLEGGRLSLDVDLVDLRDVVEAVEHEWLAEANQRGVAIAAALPPGPLPVRGDAARLVQALGNLVENALKYAGAGGRVLLEVSSDRQGRYRLAVQDSGPGIPAEALTRVFDRYFRVEGRGGHGPGGMGLGLAIARGIAVAHGGDLWAESPEGQGARFELALPTCPSKAGGGVPPAGLAL